MLTDSAIKAALADGSIVIRPLNQSDIGSNSVDLHLSPHLAIYELPPADGDGGHVLDCRKHNKLRHFDIPNEGYVLRPGVLYLGSTIEYTETHKHIPIIEGKSSLGRLGLSVHSTAGVGDVAFCNHWTLELTVCQSVRVYAGMPVAQIMYFEPIGQVETPYTRKASAKYTHVSPLPVESLMHLNLQPALRPPDSGDAAAAAVAAVAAPTAVESKSTAFIVLA